MDQIDQMESKLNSIRLHSTKAEWIKSSNGQMVSCCLSWEAVKQVRMDQIDQMESNGLHSSLVKWSNGD